MVATPPHLSLHCMFLSLVNLNYLLLPENIIFARLSPQRKLMFSQTHVFFNKLSTDFFNRLERF
jgi:hypothetical protein